MNRSIQLVYAILFISVGAHGQTKIEQAKTFFEQRKYDQVKKVLAPVGKKDTDFAAAQYYLGRVAFEEKEYEDAADYFLKATESNPKEGDYFNWLGDTYSTIGAHSNIFKQMSVGPKALRALEMAAKLDAHNINARLSLIEFYRMAPGFMGGGVDKSNATAKEAFILLDEALKNTPDHRRYLYSYGKSSALTGLKLERGEECLKKYLSLPPQPNEPSYAGANMRLGQIKEKQGSKAEAKKYYEMALKLDGSLKQAKEGLARTSK